MSESNATTKPKVYFGTRQTKVFKFPDDPSQFIEHKKLNEGERQQYEDRTGRQISLDQNTSEIRMDLATGKDRAVLFELVMVKYNVAVEENSAVVMKEGSDLATWQKLIKDMDGELAQKFLEDIRELNPWLKSSEKEVQAKVEKK